MKPNNADNVWLKCFQHRTYDKCCFCRYLASFALQRKKEFYAVQLKTHNCIQLQIFNTQNFFFQNLSLGYIVLNFCKFQPPYSYITILFLQKKARALKTRQCSILVRYSRFVADSMVFMCVYLSKDDYFRILKCYRARFQ